MNWAWFTALGCLTFCFRRKPPLFHFTCGIRGFIWSKTSQKGRFGAPFEIFFLRFLRGEASDQLADNRISDFYSLPVVDISAAVGAATAYYENLIQRALLENGFI